MRVRAVFIAGLAALAVATPAHAATFTVTGAADGAGSCDGASCTTIRAALAEASRVSGADVISLPARAYQVTQGQLQVNSAVRITGASAATTSITGDGKSSRIFNVGADQTVTISHVTIANGAAISTADGNGGNVKVDVGANLTLDHVRLTNGTALRGAGLAATAGTRITITRSLIDNNVTAFVASVGSDIGGALIVLGDARLAPNTLQISDSTIAFNRAGQGSGILLLGNPADVLTLDRVTIARNPAGSNSYGAGVGNPDGANVRIGASIIAFNTGDGTPRQCDGKPTSTGGNIETGTTCLFVAPADRPSTDPQVSTVLSAVAGGETPVLTIPATSPAVDFAPACNQADQRDLARPQGRTCDSGAYEFDQAPETDLTAGAANPGNDTTPTFSFTSSEPGSTFQCRVDTAAFTACTSPHTTAALTAGSHTFEVRAVDAGGNTDASPDAQTFVIDTTAPTAPVVTSPPNNAFLITNTVAFVGTAEPGSTVELREGATLRGSSIASGTGNWTIVMGAVPDGPHTYAARAIDAAGNTSAATSRTVTVDTLHPDTSITGGPNGLTNDATPTFTFSSEAGATFECSVDAGAHTACPNPYTTPTLNQGPHTLSVRAVDTAGNRDNTPATRNIFVDSLAPAAPVFTSPGENALLVAATVTLTGTAEAGSTIAVVEGGTPRGSTTATGGNWTVVIPNVPDGLHTYTARATDAAGNPSPPASRSVRVDTGAPDTTLDSGPAGPVSDDTPTFAFSSEPGATFECRVDGAPFSACASPHTTAPLAQGPHTFAVRAIDVAGNPDATPAASSFTVDTVAPAQPAVITGPTGPTTNPSPAFDFTSEAGTLVECRLAGPGGPGAYTACASPLTLSGLPAGDYTLFVRSTDAAGNQRETARTFTVTNVEAAQNPTPTPTPAPSPVPQQTVVVGPASGTVLIKEKGSNRFVPLDVTKGIPLGSEVDVRKGRVTLTAIGKRGASTDKADFYDGMFVVTQSGGITDLKLSEKLDCSTRARAAQKKPKKRKLWGKGTGKFRTTGSYSAATVRGTTWLVQDTCTTTLTRVTQGVVSVRDKVKRKTILVKKGKKYTARKRR